MSEILGEKALKTMDDILKAAELEFADKGFYGARVDEIARVSGANKRMIYRYFTNKEELYKVVLFEAYKKMALAEEKIFQNKGTNEEIIKNVIRLYFEYLNDNPTYVNLILWENLNRGEYINDVDLSSIKNKFYDYLYEILKDGKQNKEFRANFDENQVILSILTFSFSYFSNKYTLAKLLQGNIDMTRSFDDRVNYVTNLIMTYIK